MLVATTLCGDQHGMPDRVVRGTLNYRIICCGEGQIIKKKLACNIVLLAEHYRYVGSLNMVCHVCVASTLDYSLF